MIFYQLADATHGAKKSLSSAGNILGLGAFIRVSGD
jgi:hypothetical protein